MPGISGSRAPARAAAVTLAAAACVAWAACRSRPAQDARNDVAPLTREGLDSLIGRALPSGAMPMPGAATVQGWLVKYHAPEDPLYSVQVYLVAGHRLVLFQHEVATQGQQPVWRILDAAWLTARDTTLTIATICRFGEVADEEVFALARRSEAEWFTDVVAAWRANTTAGRFERVAVAGLSCQNEGYGV